MQFKFYSIEPSSYIPISNCLPIRSSSGTADARSLTGVAIKKIDKEIL